MIDGRQVIADILKGAPRVRIVVTSREQLHIEGELVYLLAVGSTSVPGGEHGKSNCRDAGATGEMSATNQNSQPAGAIVLSANRAALVNQTFLLTPENADKVSTISRTLSGIPLAIGLAAAWMDSFTLRGLPGLAPGTNRRYAVLRHQRTPGRSFTLII